MQPIGRWHRGTPGVHPAVGEGGGERWAEFTGQLCERLIGESVPANKWVPEAYGFIWLSGPVADGFEYLFRSLLGVLPILIPLDKDLGKRESLGSKVLLLFVLVSIAKGLFRYRLTLSYCCLLYTSPSPRDLSTSRMPSSA